MSADVLAARTLCEGGRTATRTIGTTIAVAVVVVVFEVTASLAVSLRQWLGRTRLLGAAGNELCGRDR